MRERKPQFLPYPSGALRTLLRAPLQLYRVGLGWFLRPTALLVLTTEGRKSGLPRHTVLEYRRHGSKVYLVSAWGKRPHWYRNLVEQPCVTIQRGGPDERAHASTVTNAAEALLALHMFRRNRPLYDRLFARMSSAASIDLRTLSHVADEFTVVRLDLEAAAPQLTGVRPVNRWIGPGLLVGIAVSLIAIMVRILKSKSSRDR